MSPKTEKTSFDIAIEAEILRIITNSNTLPTIALEVRYAYPECPISRINQIVWKLVDSGVLIFTQDRTFQRKKAQVSKNTKTRTALKQVGILDGVVIEGTDKITTYLDEKFPDMNAAGFLDRETREVVLQIRMKCLELEHLAIDLANAPNKR